MGVSLTQAPVICKGELALRRLKFQLQPAGYGQSRHRIIADNLVFTVQHVIYRHEIRERKLEFVINLKVKASFWARIIESCSTINLHPGILRVLLIKKIVNAENNR